MTKQTMRHLIRPSAIPESTMKFTLIELLIVIAIITTQ